jgi:hypothetical protein
MAGAGPRREDAIAYFVVGESNLANFVQGLETPIA